MASLKDKIEIYLGRSFTLKEEIDLVAVDGKPTITYWSDTIEKPKPTEDELNALERKANALQNNKIIIDKRKAEYGTIEKQIEFITEKGLEAWKTNVQAIKNKLPKESE